MAFFQFKKEQHFEYDLDSLWEFISNPRNLKRITPDYMGFNITSQVPEKMYEGLIISYKVSPVLGIKTTWVTEITHVRPLEYFVDEQRIGPYKLWHHQHFLSKTDKGVLMTDIVSYQPPMGPLGKIANSLFIKSKLEEIFAYRRKAMIEIFG